MKSPRLERKGTLPSRSIPPRLVDVFGTGFEMALGDFGAFGGCFEGPRGGLVDTMTTLAREVRIAGKIA